jgi:small subunit ribosomal protein S16
MSVKIRLRRMGAKKRPFYRVVVADSRASRDGRFIENLGYYNPCVEPPEIKIDGDRANYWLKCGAQPSDTAQALLKKQGIIARTVAADPAVAQ